MPNIFRAIILLPVSAWLGILIVAAMAPTGRVHAESMPTAYQALVPDTVADPTIVEFDGTFYLYATTDIDRGLKAAGPPVVWKSKDFVNWSFDKCIYPEATNWRYWAPGSVRRRDGKYYLFVTINGFTRVAIGPGPEGPFHDAAGHDRWEGPDAAKALCDIDGEPFVDDDGQMYVVFRGRHIGRMKDNWLEFAAPPIEIPSPRKNYTEGPFLFKRKGIYYYIYTLDGHASYKNAYLLSRTSPLGPYEVPQEDIITRTDPAAEIWGPGHGCVFNPAGTDDWYFVYLEYGAGGSTRQIFANRMAFNADGTIKPIRLDCQGVGALRPTAGVPVNLAHGAKATASSSRPARDISTAADGVALRRTFVFTPEQAIDGSNGTRWRADPDDKAAWLMVDLGSVQPTDRVELRFSTPTLGQAFVLEASVDGEHWRRCGGLDQPQARSPHIVEKTGNARFFRVTITAGDPGLWEFKVLRDGP